jgi:hypothetical protein
VALSLGYWSIAVRATISANGRPVSNDRRDCGGAIACPSAPWFGRRRQSQRWGANICWISVGLMG